LKLISYILFLIPYFLLALDPEENFNDYLLRRWNSNSGLPNNTINSIIQTQSGCIWIGTPAGLVRFDGVQFKTYTRWNTPILSNDNVRCLYEDKNQTLWIGTEGGGLFSHKQSVWKEYNKKNGLSNDHITAIISDFSDNLWIGTEYGLNRIDSKGIAIFTTHNGLYDNIILSLDIDPWGNVWAGTLRGGLAQWIKGTFRIYDFDDGLKNVSVRALYSDPIGNTWIGTFEGLFFQQLALMHRKRFILNINLKVLTLHIVT
jgi:ligand-binding sensor domain-containing protein